MKTFNGNPLLKRQYLKRAALIAAQIAGDTAKANRDKLYWSSRQCCPLPYVCQKGPSCDHRFYADEIGVPVAIAYAERAIFLDLPAKEARSWPARFLKALPVGNDLGEMGVWRSLALFVLDDDTYGVMRYTADGEQMGAIYNVVELFEQQCLDPAAWKAAAEQCRKLSHKSPYDGRRMEAAEARVHAGCYACKVAGHLARCFEDERAAAEAISDAGWCARYFRYAHHMQFSPDPRKKTRSWDENGIKMVNLGEALVDSASWLEISERGDHLGEMDRAAYISAVSEELISLLNPHPVRRWLGEMIGLAA